MNTNPLQTQNPFHPDTLNLYGLKVTVYPPINEAIHDLFKIYNLEISANFEVYDALYRAYFTSSKIVLVDDQDEDWISDTFNAMKLTEEAVRKALETHTKTYYVEVDNSIDLNDLNENQWYQAGI
jgi:hypothetical protein